MEADWTPHILYYVKKTCGESWKLDRVRISFCDLTFVTRGEATYWIDDTPYTVRAGEAVFSVNGKEVGRVALLYGADVAPRMESALSILKQGLPG